jgi:integrase
LKKGTVEQYKRDGRNHILPALGSMRLDTITVEHVERLGDRLALPTDDRPALANDSVRRIVNTLGYCLKLARKWRLIPHNPVTDAEKPGPKRRTPTIPTVKEIETLSECAPNVQVASLVRFAAYSGARIGECFGLRWENVDLTDGSERVWIVEHVYKGELVAGAKTRAGAREIVLASQAAEALRQQNAAQLVDDQPNPLGLVFPAPRGGYWRDSNFNRRVWQDMRTKAGLPGLMFHTLRYFHVSTVRAQGLPSAFTEQMVGHVDDRTHRGYTRPVEGSEHVIRAALARAFTVETEDTDTNE